NPYDGVQDQAREALRETLDSERMLDLQYSPFGGKTQTRRAIADSLRESHGLPFAFSDVICTPGAMAGLQLALRCAGEAGGEVLIPVPCWLDYHLYVRSLGMVPVSVPLSPETFDLDARAVQEAISEKTCAILFSQPSNPTGRSYTKNALVELTETLAAAEESLGCEIALISDETHRDFTREGEFSSPSSLWPRTLIVYSFGKYHFMQGQRLGYVAVGPDHPDRKNTADELVSWTRITGFATPTSLMQRAVPRLLALSYPQDWLAVWRERFVEELSASGYELATPDATLFIYARTPPPYDDFEFVQKLAASGLLVLPAPVFQHGGYFRLSLTGSEPMMEQALTTLGRFGQ
ncbi:MAG: aminotransferase class I/II-fold pyridoxal phosphate-dependent enzyme, partial [Rubrobacter sp.]|nr:aminotransferase class I/II-fold pyridoxal phosphate-dependent enzyme [Rubrobacter sp.]